MFRLKTFFLLWAVVVAASLTGCRIAPSPTTSRTPITGNAPINDIRMYYEIHGKGKPLILLHGAFGNINDWKNQIHVFSKQYKVIALDNRGHGRSTFSERPMTYSIMASDVIALMDSLGIKKAHILGWSDGGIIALELAVNYPDRLNKVIIYGGNYNRSGARTEWGEVETINSLMEQASEDYQRLSPNPNQWDSLLANTIKMWESEPNFTPKQLGAITVPVLILDGDNDGLVYTEHTIEMACLIPGAELTLIPGTGHFAPWEKPEEFNKIVMEFLAPYSSESSHY